jgi:hypothetical protein
VIYNYHANIVLAASLKFKSEKELEKQLS